MLMPACPDEGGYAAWAGKGSGEPLVLGIHPYLAPSELIERFLPLAESLGRKTGRPISIEISRDYAEHIKRIGEGQVDMAYMGPASYVEAVRKYGEFPLLAQQEIKGKPYFRGVVIKKAGSPLKGLKGLRGGKFAFGDPGSTMSHLVPRYMLLEAGLGAEDYRFEFLHSHDNVALGVLVGDFDAGAVKEETFYKYQNRGIEALSYTPRISEHLFIARRGLSAGTVESLRKAMHALSGEPGGKQVLSSIKKDLSGLVSVKNKDYDNLRRIIEGLREVGVKP